MSPKLRSRLGRRFEDFNQLVDDAIAMEEDLRLHHIEKKRSRSMAGSSGNAPQRPRLTYQQPRPQQMIIRPPQQNVQRPQYYRPAQQQNTPRPQYYRPPQQNVRAPTPPQGQRPQYPCFNCGKVRHFLRECLWGMLPQDTHEEAQSVLARTGWVGPTKSRRSSTGLLAAQDYRKRPAV